MESVTQAVCDLALQFGEGDEGEKAVMVNNNAIHIYILAEHVSNTIFSFYQSRPFGVALLLAGIDELGPQL